MKRHAHLSIGASLLALLCAPSPGRAQEPVAPPPVTTPAPPQPQPAWTGSLGAGLSVTSGNTDTTGFNLAFNAKYAPGGPGTFKAEALYLYQRSNGASTVDKTSALARYEYALSKELYAFGEVTYARDTFKNVDYLIAPLVGAGYKFVNLPNLTIAADAAIGGAFESNPGIGSRSSAAYQLGQNLTWKISPTATVNERVAALGKTQDSSDYNLHFEAGIATAVTKTSELKAAFLVDYKNEPVGIGVKKTDSALILTFLLKL